MAFPLSLDIIYPFCFVLELWLQKMPATGAQVSAAARSPPQRAPYLSALPTYLSALPTYLNPLPTSARSVPHRAPHLSALPTYLSPLPTYARSVPQRDPLLSPLPTSARSGALPREG